MKQIQKCPHCHKDSVFSHNICPNCGFESKYEERGEPDYKLDENGKVPSYAFVMEEHMTQCQRHGRILLGVIMGLLGAPLLTWAATNVFLLTDENRTMEIPLFKVFLRDGNACQGMRYVLSSRRIATHVMKDRRDHKLIKTDLVFALGAFI